MAASLCEPAAAVLRCSITAIDQCMASTFQLSVLHLPRKASSSRGRGFRRCWMLWLGGLSLSLEALRSALREPRHLKQNAVTPQWLSHAFWKSESHSFYWQLFTRVKISLHQEIQLAVFSWYQHTHELSVGHLLKELNIVFWHAFVSFWDTTLPLQPVKFLTLSSPF